MNIILPLDTVYFTPSRGALDVAKRVNQRCAAIFDYAIVKDLCENNPATGRAKVIKSYKVKHRPFLKEDELPEFLIKLENYHGGVVARSAMKLLLLTFVRPGELRNAKWEEINVEQAEWRIPAERMKMSRPHVVPLSIQALEVLKNLKPFTGKSDLLFPSPRDLRKPISDVTLLKVLIILGYTGKKNREADKIYPKVVPHGMRSTASTILNEIGKFRPDVIERQLAHVEQNKVRAAYHHAEYMDERKIMMQWWADYLYELAPPCCLNYKP